MNKHLIITGDDFGLCAAVNDAIEECLAAGTMGATCVMANMPACPQSAGLRAKFPRASIGVHWNLTQGKPLLGAKSVPSLVDGNGQFAGSLRRRWLMGQLQVAEMRAELVAQYERFCALAGDPDFWNTHQNVHVFPGLFQFFVALGNQLKIPAMRSHERVTLPARGTVLSYDLRHPSYWLKGRVIRRWSRAARARGTRMPDGRLYLPGHEAGKYALPVLLERLNWRHAGSAVELVIHPAKELDARLFGGLTESRLREYELFRDPRLAAKLKRAGVGVVGFDALSHGSDRERREQAA
ncbi:MAG: carbohydrate deacetylase [Candidatus Binatia bacterium]